MILLYHINSKSIDYCGADAFCLNSQGGFYMAISRIVKFEIPRYLENLIDIVIDKFNE